jgi:hypothetical protein
MMLSEMNRVDMEVAILEDESMYKCFNHDRLFGIHDAKKYSDDEMREIIQAWIESGECK